MYGQVVAVVVTTGLTKEARKAIICRNMLRKEYVMKSDSSQLADSAGKSSIQRSGAEITVQALIDAGVDTMFGYPGGVVLPLFDKLYDAPIRFIIPRHEQAGAHMADGYARASGKVGVIVATHSTSPPWLCRFGLIASIISLTFVSKVSCVLS